MYRVGGGEETERGELECQFNVGINLYMVGYERMLTDKFTLLYSDIVLSCIQRVKSENILEESELRELRS